MAPPEECPLNFHAWQRELAFDLDKDLILDGLQNGFKLIKEPDVSGIAGYDAVNYTSATCDEFKPEQDELFAKELGLGRISRVLVKPKCIHAIGRVPKKIPENPARITDCSRPRGNSLNDYIKPALESFRTGLDAPFHGYGAVCSDDWFPGAWAPSTIVDFSMSLYPHNWCTAGHAIDHSLRFNINILELFPVLLAARRWGPRWSHKRVCIETDNTQAMIFYQQRVLQNPLAMSWLRELFWLRSACATISISFQYICLVNITFSADRLSRLLYSSVP